MEIAKYRKKNELSSRKPSPVGVSIQETHIQTFTHTHTHTPLLEGWKNFPFFRPGPLAGLIIKLT